MSFVKLAPVASIWGGGLQIGTVLNPDQSLFVLVDFATWPLFYFTTYRIDSLKPSYLLLINLHYTACISHGKTLSQSLSLEKMC